MSTFKFNTKLEGVNEAPDRFKKACRRATLQLMELGSQHVKMESPSKVARGAFGGEGGISYIVVDKNGRFVGELHAVALNKRTGDNYLYFIVKGTGVYGPTKKRIYAKRTKYMAWMKDGSDLPTTEAGWRAAIREDRVIFRKSIAGQRPNDFITRGMKKALKRGPEIFDKEIAALNRSVS